MPKWSPENIEADIIIKDKNHVVNLLKEYHVDRREIEELKKRINKLEIENQQFKSFKEKISEIIGKDMGAIYAPPMKISEMVDYLKDRNKKKNTEITELKKENQDLKERLGIVDTEWQFESDLAWRTNHIGDFEQFGFPSPFIFSNMKNFRFIDKSKQMCHFKYRSGNDNYKEYDMPVSLYNHIKKVCGYVSGNELLTNMIQEAKQKGRKEPKEIDIHDLENEEDIKNYYLHKGGTLRGKYPIKVIKFLNKTKGEKFDIHEFDQYCRFKDNRESRRQYIHNLIEWDLIKQTKNQRIYQNLI